MDSDKICPRCGEELLRSWSELDADEREVVPRLPSARENTLEERQRSHLWCTRCWFESIDPGAQA